jgi:hypothetical protein
VKGITEYLIKVGAPVSLVLLFELLHLFTLPKLGYWSTGFAEGIRYVATLVGAAIATSVFRGKIRLSWLLISLVVCIGAAAAYQYFTTHPATASQELTWTFLLHLSFVLSYFSFGFVVTGGLSAFLPKSR